MNKKKDLSIFEQAARALTGAGRVAMLPLAVMLLTTTVWAQGTSGGGYTLTVNDQNADNTTSKFFIDEAAGETVSLDVVYSPEVSNLYAVEIYSNVGRRDFWNADIDEDGVADAIRPPSGDLVTANTEGSYFAAIPMEWDASAQVWKKTLTVGKTGVYRLTVRYKATAADEWVYYSNSTNSLGDHAVVISPKKVLAQRVYEVNGLTVKASAPSEAGRSTFADLIEGGDGFSEFGIPYLNKIQANCLWLQPIHPFGENGQAADEPGDPYATTDYFSVSKWYGKAETTTGALAEFQGFVAACDAGKSPSMSKSSVGTINVMLDAAFSMSENTEELWLSMGSYVPYWLEKTGHDFNNERIGQTDANETAYDDYGIDGLRCAFAEGFPSQFWECFINSARSKKWNFMFIAEARGGGESAARCSRLFDVVDASFETAARTAGNPSELLAATETAETACGGGAVLLNLARHDEPMPFADPWKTASSYAMLATIKGMPMTFYGQEQGIEPLQQDADGISEGTIVQPNNLWTGFAKFRLTSGKWIPDFKTWNQLTIWNNPPMGADASHGMAQLYGRVNRARAASPALQSDVQWMLDRTEGYSSTDIWAMAKAEEYGALANGKDAVLAFVLFVNDIHYATSQTFSIPAGAASMLGLEAGESYTARNLASSTPGQILWTKTTEELTSEGVWVNFTADQNGSAFYDDGAMVQFLKLEKAQPIAYVDANGDDYTQYNVTTLTGSETSLSEGWYVVNGDIDFDHTITFNGSATLILADGCTMNVGTSESPINGQLAYGIRVTGNGNDLTIYGQSLDEATAGHLNVYVSSNGNKGICVADAYVQHSGIVNIVSDDSGICAQGTLDTNNQYIGGTVAVDGGKLTVTSSNNYGIYAGGNITITGGNVSATSTDGDGTAGIYTYGNIILGWTNPTDRIYASSYLPHGNVSIVDGKAMTDGTNAYTSATSSATLGALKNKTLQPITGVTLTKDGSGDLTATFDGTSQNEVSIPADITVKAVTFNRSFTNGTASTVMLPFNYTCGDSEGGKFYAFVGVEKSEGQWIATMKEPGDGTNEATTLTANTPYLFMPSGTTMSFPAIPVSGVTLNTTGGGNQQSAEGLWKFQGTYTRLEYKEDGTKDLSGNVYGFASTPENDVQAGEFVKADDGAAVPPMRCFLTYNNGAAFTGARGVTRGESEEVPETISVRLIGKDGDINGIGTLTLSTGEFSTEGWYSLNGRRLNGKPTKKGLYINNGRKVVIK